MVLDRFRVGDTLDVCGGVGEVYRLGNPYVAAWMSIVTASAPWPHGLKTRSTRLLARLLLDIGQLLGKLLNHQVTQWWAPKRCIVVAQRSWGDATKTGVSLSFDLTLTISRSWGEEARQRRGEGLPPTTKHSI